MTAVEFLKQNLPSFFVDDFGHYEKYLQTSGNSKKSPYLCNNKTACSTSGFMSPDFQSGL